MDLEEEAISNFIFRVPSRRRTSSRVRIFLPGIAPLLVAGCALPVGVQIATLVADGVFLMTTEKTIADHGISAVTKQHCAVWRGSAGEAFCRKYPEVTSPVFDLNDEDPSGIEGPTPTADASASDFTPSRVRSISASFNPPAAFATRSAEPAVVEAAGKTEDDANPADRPAAEFITASGDNPAPSR